MTEEQFGKGAIKNKIDLRDYRYKKIYKRKAAATIPFNWINGYDVEAELRIKLNDPSFTIPVKDQNGSLSCVGQASAYLESVHDAFEKGVYTEKSARDAYSQIFYKGGGSSTRDALNLLTSKGICREKIMTSYEHAQPPSEVFMERRFDATPATVADANTAKGTAYAPVALNFDAMAQAVRDDHGILITVDGQNNGTWLSPFPKPPINDEWSHELYIGRARMINGKKYLGVINSWGRECGDRGWQWLGEEYLPFIHSTGVLFDTTVGALIQEKTWLEDVLELLQKFINSLGYEPKKTLN